MMETRAQKKRRTNPNRTVATRTKGGTENHSVPSLPPSIQYHAGEKRKRIAKEPRNMEEAKRMIAEGDRTIGELMEGAKKANRRIARLEAKQKSRKSSTSRVYKRPPIPSKAPSSMTSLQDIEADVHGQRWDNYRLLECVRVLNGLQVVERLDEHLFGRVVDRIWELQRMAIGVRASVKNGMFSQLSFLKKELPLSSVLSCLLQEMFAVSSGSDDEILCVHQGQVSTNDEHHKPDCVVYAEMKGRRKGHEPLIFFEFAVSESTKGKKLVQLSDVVALFHQFSNCQKSLLLGVFWGAESSHLCYLELHGYYTLYNDGETLVRDVILCEMYCTNDQDLKRFLRVCWWWAHRDNRLEGEMGSDVSWPVKEWHPIQKCGSNVVLCENDQNEFRVFKLFDYGGTDERKDCLDKRSPNKNIYDFMGKPKVELMYFGDNLTILGLEYIYGSRDVTCVAQVVEILSQLKKLHEEDYVHGDIRISNLIFAEEAKESCIIDYDFAGKVDEVEYPEGFNRDIDDGQRHDEACEESTIKKEHDLYSMAWILGKMKIAGMQRKWKDMISHVENGRIQEALDELETIKNKDKGVKWIRGFRSPTHVSTGSPQL